MEATEASKTTEGASIGKGREVTLHLEDARIQKVIEAPSTGKRHPSLENVPKGSFVSQAH